MHVGRAVTHGAAEPVRSSGARRRWRRGRARVRAVRAKVRRTPLGRLVWRIGVGLVGGLLLIVGIIAIPGPGQGWALVFLALAILSTEFAWAQRLRHGLWVRLMRARTVYAAMPRRTRAVLGVVGALMIAVILLLASWLSLALAGLPGWVPEPATDLLGRLPGVN